MAARGPYKKTTVSQCSPVRLEQARLVSSLLYGTRAMFVLNLPDFTQFMTVSMETVRMAKSRPRIKLATVEIRELTLRALALRWSDLNSFFFRNTSSATK